jgi:hypothetical protein
LTQINVLGDRGQASFPRRERSTAMGTFAIRLNDRFRGLVVCLRGAWAWALGAGRSPRDAGSPFLDLRPTRRGSRPEFRQMAQRYHVDLARTPLDLGAAVRDAELICANCQDVRRCRRWLARKTVDDPRLFCANAPLFKLLAPKQADATVRGR